MISRDWAGAPVIPGTRLGSCFRSALSARHSRAHSPHDPGGSCRPLAAGRNRSRSARLTATGTAWPRRGGAAAAKAEARGGGTLWRVVWRLSNCDMARVANWPPSSAQSIQAGARCWGVALALAFRLERAVQK
jgi:hypothetical protein